MLLSIAGISKQIYSYNVKHFDDKKNKDVFYDALIKEIFDKNYQKYGSPRMTIAVNHRLSELNMKPINHKKVERIMNKLGLKARPAVRKYDSYRGKIGKTAKNLLLVKTFDEEKKYFYRKRNFETTGPLQIAGTDVTVFIMPFGKLYLSPIIDFHTREILAYDLSEKPDYRQIDRMFKMLEQKQYQTKGLILHSDQGWQYQMKCYVDKLKALEILQSMSRKGNCLDNSPTENFFGRLKEEMFYRKEKTFTNMHQLKKAIIDYIDYWNNYRIVTRLKMSPFQYKNSLLNVNIGV